MPIKKGQEPNILPKVWVVGIYMFSELKPGLYRRWHCTPDIYTEYPIKAAQITKLLLLFTPFVYIKYEKRSAYAYPETRIRRGKRVNIPEHWRGKVEKHNRQPSFHHVKRTDLTEVRERASALRYLDEVREFDTYSLFE